MFKRFSFQLKLQLTVVAVGLIGFGFIAELAYQGLEAAYYSKELELKAGVKSASDKVDRNLFERYGDVQAFALSEPARSGDPQRIMAFMKDMMKAYSPIYDTMMVLNSKGVVIAVNSVDKSGKPLDPHSFLGKNYSRSEWFQLAIGGKIEDGAAHYTDLYIDEDVRQYVNTDGRTMAFTAPIKNPVTGEILGVWSNRMSWKDVVETIFVEEVEKTKTEYITQIIPALVNAEGTYLFYPTDPKKVLTAKKDISEFLAIKKKDWYHETNETDGKLNESALEAYTSSVGYGSYPGQKWYYSMMTTKNDDFIWRVKMIALISLMALFAVNIMAFFVIRASSRRIEKVIEVLRGESDKVSRTADDVTKASGTLAESSTEQAAALQETAASIEEINAMIKKSTDNAEKSQEVAVQSSNIATKGKEAVDEMSRAIHEINTSNDSILNQIAQSNNQISEIAKVISEIGTKTKVINDIVFQTKLLSFNASVEAARAGEHGKGFAVVAQEVGNLAQMSGNAAKEISDMLDASIQRVESIVNETKTKVERLVSDGRVKIQSGVVIAKQCGDVLTEVVENVKELNGMVSEISIASKEQAQGVNEITKAMNELDKTTHGNATTSRQVSGYAGQLSSQADTLNMIVKNLVAVIRGEGEQGEFHSPVTKDLPENVRPLRPHAFEMKTPEPKVTKLKVASGESVPTADDPRFKEV